MYLILIILLIFLCIGAWPGIGFQHSYGYAPIGIGGIILIILVILLLSGRL